MSEVLNAIRDRFSTRGYKPDKLSEEILDKLIEAGLQAPTAANRQEVHFSVIDGDNPVLQEIEDEKNRLFNAAPANNFYYNAPTVFILSADSNMYWSPLDAGIAVENIALAAEALGLGSLIIGCVKDALRGEKAPEFAAKLGFPEGYQYEVALAVGYKDFTKEPHTYDRAKNVTIVK